MNEILKKRIEEAAAESRRASAETLTTFGLQSSIDDVVELTGMELSYDEVAESAFEKGADYALSHQWISVEEALPPLLKRVLVISEKTKKVGITYRYQNPSQQPKWLNYEYVTWWMPIPKFETKEKEE